MQKISALLAILIVLMACNKKNASENTEAGTTGTVQSEVGPTDSLSQPSEMTPAMQSDPAATAAPQMTTAAGMNPAHGEPGHRCDIAVGAPLNSPPNAGGSPPGQMSQQPTILSSPQAAPAPAPVTLTQTPAPAASPAGAASTTTAPGMNPPHGQPGHDCAIAVGAPLKK